MVDEVLAVGDMAFQKKCLGKMESVSKGGRTVLFVSHNMGVISELCSRCMLLSNGQVTAIGDTNEIVGRYISSNRLESGEIDLSEWSLDRGGPGPMRILHLSTEDSNGQIRSQFAYGEPITFNVKVSGHPGKTCTVGLSIRNSAGFLILHFNNTDDSFELPLTSSVSKIRMHLPQNILNDGTYNITVWLGDGLNILHDVVRRCLFFDVDSSTQGRVKSLSPVRLPATWSVK